MAEPYTKEVEFPGIAYDICQVCYPGILPGYDIEHGYLLSLTIIIVVFRIITNLQPMRTPDPSIVSFIRGQGECSLAWAGEEGPYAASCFYAFLEEPLSLVFKSESKTRHIRMGMEHPDVAGTIVERSRKPGIIRGLQFKGRMNPPVKFLEQASDAYYKRYPFARVFSGELWLVELQWIKMTDNTPLTGKKVTWEKVQI